MPLTPSAGRSFPLGATVQEGGVNFSVFSKSASTLSLLLFDSAEQVEPSATYTLDRQINRTFHYWHIFVPGLGPGQIYAFAAHGPNEPELGHRFDRDKVLLDPYGRGIAMTSERDRHAAARPGNNSATAYKSVVLNSSEYDWQGDAPLERPWEQTIIYELHVGGFTKNPNSGVAEHRRGTYLGLIDKIPYLVELGVTAVELLPVFHFDEQDGPPGLSNYWGYSPVSFFAPHLGYATRPDAQTAMDEFRDMVKAMHKAGLEVILDVVYNHTAEGDETGPTQSFKGLENAAYYILHDGQYANYSGCGNTMNGNQPVVRRMILDSLRFWVSEMHVDGFRFDLASILSRDESGQPLANPPILWDIETDPYFAHCKLIAEAWDASGLYQVGSFIGDRWKEWNGRFRDDVRGFIKGDAGHALSMKQRFLASPDLYIDDAAVPEQSINFVTCHDGFTMSDLVSYAHKHNLANHENNRDGDSHNLSWNCGVEGPSDDPQIQALRLRQMKNLFTVTLLSLGVPMLSMGDEVRRTQQGNNNAYCQDNLLSWFNWDLVHREAELLSFVQRLVRLRHSLNLFTEQRETTLEALLAQGRVRWHGVQTEQPDWGHSSRSLALQVMGQRRSYFIVLNAYWEPLEFELPPGLTWRRMLDTARPAPADLLPNDEAPEERGTHGAVSPRSAVVFIATLPVG